MKFLYGARSLLFWVVICVSVVPAALFVLIIAPFTSYETRYGIARAWCRFIISALKVICGVRFQFKNLENLPTKEAVILMSKHQSAWETLAFTGYLPRRLTFVYKRELNRIPIFGWALATLGMFSINREQGRGAFEQLKKGAPTFLAKGWVFTLFPEGTRTKPGQVPKYKSGGSRIAIAAGVSVVPVALNSGECWPRNSFLKYPGMITVSLGPLISSEGKNSNQLTSEVQNWIESEMRVISPRFYP